MKNEKEKETFSIKKCTLSRILLLTLLLFFIIILFIHCMDDKGPK